MGSYSISEKLSLQFAFVLTLKSVRDAGFGIILRYGDRILSEII